MVMFLNKVIWNFELLSCLNKTCIFAKEYVTIFCDSVKCVHELANIFVGATLFAKTALTVAVQRIPLVWSEEEAQYHKLILYV